MIDIKRQPLTFKTHASLTKWKINSKHSKDFVPSKEQKSRSINLWKLNYELSSIGRAFTYIQ